MPHLRVVDLTVDRGPTRAVERVSFEVEPGTLVAVIGPNGAGKSTLFGAISGRLRPTAGSTTVNGSVADVLQATALDPQVRLTVQDVVRMGRYPDRGLLCPFRRHDRDLVRAAMATMDLADLRRRPIDALSGGQRQRALVAQGLAQDADVVLLDEPAAGLDVASQERILEAMRREADRGKAVLFSTHLLDEIHLADLVVVLAGRCVCCDTPVAVAANRAVHELFGDRSLTALTSRAGV